MSADCERTHSAFYEPIKAARARASPLRFPSRTTATASASTSTNANANANDDGNNIDGNDDGGQQDDGGGQDDQEGPLFGGAFLGFGGAVETQDGDY